MRSTDGRWKDKQYSVAGARGSHASAIRTGAARNLCTCVNAVVAPAARKSGHALHCDLEQREGNDSCERHRVGCDGKSEPNLGINSWEHLGRLSPAVSSPVRNFGRIVDDAKRRKLNPAFNPCQRREGSTCPLCTIRQRDLEIDSKRFGKFSDRGISPTYRRLTSRYGRFGTIKMAKSRRGLGRKISMAIVGQRRAMAQGGIRPEKGSRSRIRSDV